MGSIFREPARPSGSRLRFIGRLPRFLLARLVRTIRTRYKGQLQQRQKNGENAMGSKEEREKLAAKFERHADEEGKILAQYRILSEQLGDSAAGTLVSHILTEEELHHLLLHTMAKWLREPAAGPADAVPASANRPELLRVTRTLRQHERETIDACRRLKSQLSAPSAGLLGTLLEAMILDSEKHHRLLEAAEKLIER
jgi:hypothetical protein